MRAIKRRQAQRSRAMTESNARCARHCADASSRAPVTDGPALCGSPARGSPSYIPL
jgi:hypothetical protein